MSNLLYEWQSWARRVRGSGEVNPLPWQEWRTWRYLIHITILCLVPGVHHPYRGLPPQGQVITPRGKLK